MFLLLDVVPSGKILDTLVNLQLVASVRIRAPREVVFGSSGLLIALVMMWQEADQAYERQLGKPFLFVQLLLHNCEQ